VRRVFIAAAVAIIAAGAVAGILVRYPDGIPEIMQRLFSPAEPLSRESWTLAFYLAGDNSLERDQLENLREICEGSPAVADTPVVVFIDRDDDISRDSPLTAWKGSRLFVVTKKDYLDVIRSPIDVDIPRSVEAGRFERSITARLQDPRDRDFILEHYEKKGGYYVLGRHGRETGERIRAVLAEKPGYLLPLRGREHANLDAVDGRTLSRFVRYVKDNFPSERYLLCIAGHGSGWFGNAAGILPQAENRSGEYFRGFEIQGLRQALQDEPVDVLVLDMCSMGDIETAWELKDCTRYLVSNQTAVPTMGLDYTLLLRRLGRRQALTPQDIAGDAVEAYRDTYGGFRQFALSAAALDLGDDFEAFVESFQRAVSDPALLPAIRKAGRDARSIPGRHRSRYPMIDLLPLAGALGDAELESLSSRRQFMIRHAAVNSELTGISVYLPATAEDRLLHEYAETSFARDFPRGWVSVLPGLLADR